jgi:group I intron endonuclease
MQGVYAWVCTINGRVYVGSAVNVTQRKYAHTVLLNGRRHPNTHLQAAWLKYGTNAFEFELLEQVGDLVWLRAREQAWITRLRACDREFGYNVTSDAWAPVSSPETIAKMKKAWVARKARGDYYKFTPEDTVKGTTAAGKKNKARWQDPKIRAEMQEAQKAGWTSEVRSAQAERFKQQILKDPTMLSRGGVKGSAVRWGKVN